MIARKKKTYTAEEKELALARCFWWFFGLLILNIGTFWVPLVKSSSRNANDNLIGWIMGAGLVTNCVLSIVFIYKFATLRGTMYVEILWILPALIPFTAPISFLLLCNSAFMELSRLGSRRALHFSRM